MDKKFSKRYLIMILSLFVGTFLVSLGIVFGIQFSDRVAISLSGGQSLLLSLCCALVPTCAFNGFVFMLGRVKELDNKKAGLFLLLVLPIALLCVPVGAVVLVPMIISAFKKVLDKL